MSKIANGFADPETSSSPIPLGPSVGEHAEYGGCPAQQSQWDIELTMPFNVGSQQAGVINNSLTPSMPNSANPNPTIQPR